MSSGSLTVLILSFWGWYTPSRLNLDDGISVHALLPSESIFHSFSGLVASPANLQLMPTIAIGSYLGMFSSMVTFSCYAAVVVHCCLVEYMVDVLFSSM